MLIFISFCIIILIQISFYAFLFGRFSYSKSIKGNNHSFPVSIIVCAKNEGENLKKHLPLLALQNYPDFEIVLVDDASTDDSLEIMNQFKAEYSSKNRSVQILSLANKTSKGKKEALTLGINKAKHKYLLLTDADCYPVSKNWITEMTSHFSIDKTIVLGYGAYRKIENSFLNKLIRFETLLTAIQYFSYAKTGKAYMGVGRNMAYLKEEFTKAEGFSKHKNTVSGDDDLLIGQIATAQNTAICSTKNSFTISEPETNCKDWIGQKRRHITTSFEYKIFHKFLLGLFYISQILFWLLLITLLILEINTSLTIFLGLFRLVIWYGTIIRSAYKLNENDLILLAPVYEISIIFIQLYLLISNLISPPKNW